MGKTIALVIAVCLVSMSAVAKGDIDTSDPTPVTECEKLPYSASIMVFSISDAKAVCREMLKVMEGVTLGDLRSFQISAYVFANKGYDRSYKQITTELVNIIRLRGLYNKRDRWKPTTEMVWKTFSASNGLITPSDVVFELYSAGPEVRNLTDEAFETMLILLWAGRKDGTY